MVLKMEEAGRQRGSNDCRYEELMKNRRSGILASFYKVIKWFGVEYIWFWLKKYIEQNFKIERGDGCSDKSSKHIRSLSSNTYKLS